METTRELLSNLEDVEEISKKPILTQINLKTTQQKPKKPKHYYHKNKPTTETDLTGGYNFYSF